MGGLLGLQYYLIRGRRDDYISSELRVYTNSRRGWLGNLRLPFRLPLVWLSVVNVRGGMYIPYIHFFSGDFLFKFIEIS